MHCAYNRWSVWASPCWSRQFVCRLRVFTQQVLDRTRNLSHLSRHVEEVHFVIPLANFVRYATCPCLDFVESKLFFVVSRFTDVHLFIRRETSRAAFVEPCHKHDKASTEHISDWMVTILTGLNHFMFIKVFFKSMDSLLWSVVPACIDPFFPCTVLPCPVYLSHNRFAQVIGVSNVYPVTFVIDVRIWLACLEICNGLIRTNFPSFSVVMYISQG